MPFPGRMKLAVKRIRAGINTHTHTHTHIYIYIYIYIRGLYDKFPDFFRTGI